MSLAASFNNNPNNPQQSGGSLAASFAQQGEPQDDGTDTPVTPAAPASPLPFMADSLDKNGQAYYGEGFKGFAKKTFAKIFDPSKIINHPTEQQAQLLEEGQQKGEEILNRTGWDEWITKWTGIEGEDITSAAMAVNLASRGTDEEGNVNDKTKLGESIKTVAGTMYRGGGQVISAGLEALGVFDKISRKVQAFNAAVDSIGDSSSVMPDITQNDVILKKMIGDTPTAQRLGNMLNAFADINPILGAYNLVRAATAGGTMYQKVQTVKDNLRASNMIYTMYWDESKKSEYFRRVQAGENPDLVMREIELPWVELAGSIIGDPSSYLGAGLVKNIGKAKTPIRMFGKTIANLPWESAGHIPGFSEILGLKNIGKARLTGTADQWTAVADEATAKAFQALGNIKDEAQALPALKAAINSTRKMMSDARGSYGFAAMESTAKAELTKKTVGTFFHALTQRFRNPDEVLDTFKAFRNMSSTNDQVALRAFSHLKETLGTLPFTSAGMQSMEFMAKLIDDVDIGAMLAKHGNDIPAFTDDAFAKLNGVVDDFYPSINDMAKAKSEVKALGVTASKRQQELAKSYDDLAKSKPTVIWANNVNNAIAGNKAYQGLQGFFSNVLMGMKPGYAIRNLISNTVTIWHDLGARAGVEAFTTGAETLVKSAAGRALKQDWANTVIARETDKIKNILGFLPTQTIKGVGSAGKEGFGFIAVGGDVEKVHSALITRYVVEAEAEKFLKHGGIPDVDTLGLPKEMAESLLSHTLETFGNVGETLKRFRNDQATGFYETWRHLELDPNFKDTLRRSSLLDELDDIRKTAPDPVAFSEQMDAFINKIDELAKRTADEPALVSAENEMSDVVVTLEKAFDEGTRKLMSEDELNQFRAVTELRSQLRQQYQDYADVMRDRIGRLLPPEQVRPFEEAFSGLRKTLDDGNTKWRNYADDLYKGVYAQSKKGVPPSELWGQVRTVMLDLQDGKPVLKKISMAQAYPNVDPTTITNKDFDGMMWKWFKEQQSSFWRGYTQDAIVGQEAILEQMAAKAGVTVDQIKLAEYGKLDNPRLDTITRTTKQLDEWENYLDYSSFSQVGAKVDQAAGNIIDESKDFYNEGKPYLRVANEKSPMSDWGHAMFADNREGYFDGITKGMSGYEFKPKLGDPGVVRSEDLSEDIWKAFEEDVNQGFYNGDTNDDFQNFINMYENGDITKDSFIKMFSPTDIVDSAEAYDSILSNWLWDRVLEKKNISSVITPDGAIVFDEAMIKKAGESISKATPSPTEANKAMETVEQTAQAAGQATTPQTLSQMDLNNVPNWKGGKSHLFNTVNKEREARGLARYATIDEVPFDEAAKVLSNRTKPIPPMVDGNQPTQTRQLYENMQGGLRTALEDFKNGTLNKWGQKSPMETKLTDTQEAAISKWAVEVDRRTVSRNASVSAIADATRDFILHDYNKTYGDKFASFFTMYHYWPSRTYARWMERAIDTPGVPAAYAKLRQTLEKVNSDQPEFYRYNMQIPTLPGLNNSPMFFNLEAVLNPMNSLTGTDYTDPKKRVDWLSSAADDMGKFGFNMAMPLQWLMAARLYNKQEDEAARRWLGRMVPVTQDIKAALNLLHDKTGIDLMPDISALPGAKYGEFDPFINAQGGLDPYEEKRIGNALTKMVMTGEITQEQAYDIMYKREGPEFDQAVQNGILDRAGGQMASFFGGIGFKKRTEEDLKIEEFYNKYYKLLSVRENIAPEEYRAAFDKLRGEYDFADTVLLAAKGGDDRDAVYAYNVLGRIPPGDSTDVLQGMGLSEQLIQKFYNDKGDFSEWTPQDKERFMGAMLDLGATFAMPEDGTREEWNEAKDTYKGVQEAISDALGLPYDGKERGVWDMVSTYYDMRDQNEEAARMFKESHPEVDDALLMLSEAKISDPVLAKYYASLDTVETYYSGKIRAQLFEKFGKDIMVKQAQYYEKGYEGKASQKAYLAAHPELKAYWSEKNTLEQGMDQKILELAGALPDAAEGAKLREGFTPQNATQEQLAQLVENNVPWSEISMEMTPGLQNSLVNFMSNGAALTPPAQKELDYLAKKLDYYNADDLMRTALFALMQDQEVDAPAAPASLAQSFMSVP